jgi:tripeptidyl-peptidase-1
VLSRINNARLAAGKTTLGWVNPRLYRAAEVWASQKSAAALAQLPSAFHDVVEGNNGHTSGNVSCVGFNATVGWDPMTGLGTPFYPSLLAALLQD